MIITSCAAFFYELPLVTPLRLGQQALSSRRGFILQISAGDQGLGYGEVAPFPGLHKENVAAALQQFRQLQTPLTGSELPNGLPDLQALENWLVEYPLYPSLRHGLETAVLDLLAGVNNTTLAGLLNPSYQQTLPVNGLLADGIGIQEQVRRLLAEGYTAVKLKVGRQSLEQDIALVRTVRQALGSATALRLDANRSWDFATAVRFGKALADCPVEYLEEPLADPQRSADFYHLTGIPVALDESLAGWEPETVSIAEGIQAFVLKPAVLGGLARTARFIRLAGRQHIKAVISSVFESGVGLAALTSYAAALSAGVPAGLDTYRWLREDLPVQRFAAHGGKIAVDSVYRQARRLRADLLTRVA
jgi:O-succinylbenzoate synthase